MRRRRLLLAPEHRGLVEAAARDAAPEECCGILVGRRPAADVRLVTRVVEAVNVTAGNRERSYEIAPSEVIGAWRRARAVGEEILGFYHSHPGGLRRPSPHDELGAWSGMSYVIVTTDEESCELTSWRRESTGSTLAGREHGGQDRAGAGLEREEIREPRRWEGLS